ncbi:TetR/AcrR family transcriptional regulator [Streptomyces olivaceiscleroticus]|uniref:TetR/AcrR family transcriptional regulator C-terminal domain-containing protein n=1 Tax=Streptomyces olivaceiscleroticus TaxID=68245 RepID=A0ABN1BCD6_9ACTN
MGKSEPTGAARMPVWAREHSAPRRRAPSVDQIVRRAVTVADEEGVAAVSMRRIATDLGSGTASLYRYIAGRDELLDLMIDAVHGEEAPPVLAGDWRADLTSFARQQRAILLRHPWLTAELTGRPPLGPNWLRRADTVLSAAAALTCDATLATQAVGVVQAYVSGAVSAEVAEEQARQRHGLTEEEWQSEVGPYIRTIVDAGHHPHLARRIVEAEEVPPDQVFDFGLACVLDGLAARMLSRGRGGSAK